MATTDQTPAGGSVPARKDRHSTVMLAAIVAPFAIIVAILVVGSLPTAADKAEQRLAMVKATGDKDAICTAAKDVADAWLKQLDRQKYARAKTEADIACLDLAYQTYEREHGL